MSVQFGTQLIKIYQILLKLQRFEQPDTSFVVEYIFVVLSQGTSAPTTSAPTTSAPDLNRKSLNKKKRIFFISFFSFKYLNIMYHNFECIKMMHGN